MNMSLYPSSSPYIIISSKGMQLLLINLMLLFTLLLILGGYSVPFAEANKEIVMDEDQGNLTDQNNGSKDKGKYKAQSSDNKDQPESEEAVSQTAPDQEHIEEELWTAWEEVELDMDEQEMLQEQVDGGHRVGLLDPYDSGARFVNDHYKEFGKIERVDDVSEERDQILRYTFENECKVEVRLIKPVKQGITGIWAVSEVRTTTNCSKED